MLGDFFIYIEKNLKQFFWAKHINTQGNTTFPSYIFKIHRMQNFSCRIVNIFLSTVLIFVIGEMGFLVSITFVLVEKWEN